MLAASGSQAPLTYKSCPSLKAFSLWVSWDTVGSCSRECGGGHLILGTRVRTASRVKGSLLWEAEGGPLQKRWSFVTACMLALGLYSGMESLRL